MQPPIPTVAASETYGCSLRSLRLQVRLAASVALSLLLPAACLRGTAAAGAQPRLRTLARAGGGAGLLCLGLCGYAVVNGEWFGS